ncbi:TadE-like protein [Gemmata obscuriglobus]|uniref:Pilus assembly protein n=1 Tax=Gemmata obscuriglobus TaxID=114 RepID=A0A2Z3HH28_9BACT|nr:TadE family protein [Gemmata obscuriglobus]AWM40690.1 pilus assembly protein [Gemmata obscuriglobus]QEG26043.1 TadE-like protein [Gemmata obscuriglobus]VTS00412.1 TadE-like protein OS=Singulisphaera acidiphila (strain ATCC BAA-1392 / DSM 18658 / VKM B-2454 / MOB10) GN=Sinac_7489 PE=4 SV=1: TadE [Gemmata obscuriglobus UQM 2246]
MRRSPRPARRGVAAIELAFVFMLFVIPLMFGIWELGRLVQVQQLVSNATREGARLSAQAYTINSSGAPTQIRLSTGTVNVQASVYQYLYAAGLTNLQLSDVTVEFAFSTPRTTDYVPLSTDPTGTNYPFGSYPPEPCYGEKGMIFTLKITIPWSKVRWINKGLISPSTVSFTVTWQMLTDDRFQVNGTLPTW